MHVAIRDSRQGLNPGEETTGCKREDCREECGRGLDRWS